LIDSKISLAASARFWFYSRRRILPRIVCLSVARKSAQLKANIMKSAWIVWIALLVLGAALEAQQKYSGGIVYGPKAAFNISAPQGWVLGQRVWRESGAAVRPLSERFIVV
jgi:hypothetical protein